MSDNINTGDGSKGKHGDILRGILKIRRKRNSSVTKASSRGDILDLKCFNYIMFCKGLF